MRNKWILFGLILMFLSCGQPDYFNTYKSFKNNQWAIDKPQVFDVAVNDSLARYNIFINLRNNNQYPYSNLFLIVKTYVDKNIFEIDTLEYQMADETGHWLGTGFADVKENKLVFKSNYVFKHKANYQYQIYQADRKNGQINGDSFLKGLTDIGLQIEKIK